MLSKYVLLMDFSILRYRIKATSSGEQTVYFVETQACLTRYQPSELFKIVFIQVVLSLLASVYPVLV